MDEQMNRKYYTSRKLKFLEEFDEGARYWKQAIANRYGDDFANTIVRESREGYEALIPEIPYVGGGENHLTGNLIESARCLVLYKAMKARGKTAGETGKILYDAIKARGPNPPIPPSQMLSPKDLMRRRRERAERSQERRYPGDWVYEFVEGDGVEFDYGYDFVECASQKFYRAQGADELLPFYCFLDFPKSRANGLGLVRTMTLAEGYGKCDFRFKKGRRSEREWPPPFLEKEMYDGGRS